MEMLAHFFSIAKKGFYFYTTESRSKVKVLHRFHECIICFSHVDILLNMLSNNGFIVQLLPCYVKHRRLSLFPITPIVLLSWHWMSL